MRLPMSASPRSRGDGEEMERDFLDTQLRREFFVAQYVARLMSQRRYGRHHQHSSVTSVAVMPASALRRKRGAHSTT